MTWFLMHMILYAAFGYAYWHGLADSPDDINRSEYYGEEETRKHRITVLATLGGFMLTSTFLFIIIIG